jgi:hypothetical protein
VQDKSPLGLDRAAQQNAFCPPRFGTWDGELIEDLSEGQDLQGMVQDQTHGVVGVMGEDQGHRALETRVADRRQGDQELTGEVGGRIHMRLVRRSWGGFKTRNPTWPLQAGAKELSVPIPNRSDPGDRP